MIYKIKEVDIKKAKESYRRNSFFIKLRNDIKISSSTTHPTKGRKLDVRV